MNRVSEQADLRVVIRGWVDATVFIAARWVACPRLVKLGFRYYKEAHPPSERGGSYDLPALRRHRPGEQTNLRRVRIADALAVQCMRKREPAR
jgi:hypothetical protein